MIIAQIYNKITHFFQQCLYSFVQLASGGRVRFFPPQDMCLFEVMLQLCVTQFGNTASVGWYQVGWRPKWGGWIILLLPAFVMSQFTATLNDIFSYIHREVPNEVTYWFYGGDFLKVRKKYLHLLLLLLSSNPNSQIDGTLCKTTTIITHNLFRAFLVQGSLNA